MTKDLFRSRFGTPNSPGLRWFAIRLVTQYESGQSQRSIAADYSISRSWVYSLIHRFDKEPCMACGKPHPPVKGYREKVSN